MPAGGVNVFEPAHAPPKTSRSAGDVVVMEGAVTGICDVEPLLWPPEASIGAAMFAPPIARMPPDMSSAEPTSVNVYDAGSKLPATLYQLWIRAFVLSNQSVFGTAVHPLGGVMFLTLPP